MRVTPIRCVFLFAILIMFLPAWIVLSWKTSTYIKLKTLDITHPTVTITHPNYTRQGTVAIANNTRQETVAITLSNHITRQGTQCIILPNHTRQGTVAIAFPNNTRQGSEGIALPTSGSGTLKTLTHPARPEEAGQCTCAGVKYRQGPVDDISTWQKITSNHFVLSAFYDEREASY